MSTPTHTEVEVIEALVTAARTAQFEFITLIPRLTEPYRKNAQECVNLLKAAIKLNEERLVQGQSQE